MFPGVLFQNAALKYGSQELTSQFMFGLESEYGAHLVKTLDEMIFEQQFRRQKISQFRKKACIDKTLSQRARLQYL